MLLAVLKGMGNVEKGQISKARGQFVPSEGYCSGKKLIIFESRLTDPSKSGLILSDKCEMSA